MSKFLAGLGVVLTTLYLSFALWLVGGRLYMLQTMELNAVGDFFAGIFGPLAILWLVLGFFQQGIELRQNNDALKLQAEELRNSVEQQRELVGVTARQVSIEMEKWQHERRAAAEAAKPVFNLVHSSTLPMHDGYWYKLLLSNIGRYCQQVVVYLRKDEHESRIFNKATLKATEEVEVNLPIHGEGLLSRGHQIHIECLDSLGGVNTQVFDIESFKEPGTENPAVLIDKIYAVQDRVS
ncbi:hypothetical protein PSGK_09860 [Pseudomonas solani]|uniref:hypothetical protein n=1 Tax=Pseudomonas solani TaxID=2731552 RepID=UPI0035BE3668